MTFETKFPQLNLVCKLPTIFVIEVSQFEIRDESLIGLFGSERREGQQGWVDET